MMHRRDLLLSLAIVGAALIVRLAFAALLVFPPLDDPAFYVQTARHLAEGRGLVSDVIWSYQLPFAQVPHPSHEYWMPLATFLMAPFIRFFGDSLFAAQLPGALCGALLAPATYWLARQMWPGDRTWAVGASALLIAGALPVYQSASVDSAAPYALCASLALIAGGLSIERGSGRWAIASGVLSGLAYLARSDGLLIPMLLLAGLLLRRNVRSAIGLAAGAGVVVGAWWLRNLAVFGVMQPVSPWTAVALQSYGQLFNWKDPPTLAGLVERGPGLVIDLRLRAVWHNLGVWSVTAFPYGLIGLPGLFTLRRPLMRMGLLYALALFFVSALIFSVPTMAGLFYHSAGATLPWLAVGAMAVLKRLADRRKPIAVGVYVMTIALIAAQAALAWPAAVESSRADRAKFGQAAEWLSANVPADQPVIATQAHSLNYASGYPALTLPNEQAVTSVRQLAEYYGARFVVVTERVGLYPDALDAAQDSSVQRHFDAVGVVIYDLGPAR